MTELLAILTVIFVVYSLYEVFKTACQSDDDTQSAAGSLLTAAAVSPSPAAPKPVAAPSPQPSTVTPSNPAQVPTQAEADKIVHLRDPSTGEASPVPSNYRFAKKWIKEALVTEGLLNKVYKNSELTESVNTTVKEALEKFKKLERYHA